MPIHLLKDPLLFCRPSTLESERMMPKIISKNLDELENGAGALFEAIKLVKTSIQASLSNLKDFDSSAILNQLKSLESRLVKIESRLDKIEGKKDQKPAQKENDDFDLFGSDEEPAQPKKQQPVQEKKAKPAKVEKSIIVLEIKPLEQDTDMEKLEGLVRDISLDGLSWGGSDLIPVAYGIKKLIIQCIIEDDKIDVEDLENAIMAHEDYVQSVDVASFNKAG